MNDSFDKGITLIEEDSDSKFVSPVCITGRNKQLLWDLRIHGNKALDLDPIGEDTCNSIFSNSYQAANYLASAKSNDEKTLNLSKILAVGKVQSGKTAFFISLIALAFDNGYSLAYVIGGTKNELKSQNGSRIQKEFSNNPDVIVMNFDYNNYPDIESKLKEGKKVILIVLKNATGRKNLNALKETSKALSDWATIVIDDEGDEYSPGAPNTKKRDNATHAAISEVVKCLRTCTYVSVTATPQANFLIDTDDPLSPDYCVLVKPGKGYVGGIDFHDDMSNRHVEIIADAVNFLNSVPESFNSALRYFITACAIKIAQGDFSPFSMLVNPSLKTSIHRDVSEKISKAIDSYISLFDGGYGINGELDKIEKTFSLYKRINPESTLQFDEVTNALGNVIDGLKCYQYNSTKEGSLERMLSKESGANYKIFVGGSMLGRGLTIKNLIVTYIYNDSKVTSVDTLYQRARWLGYKSKYYDVCRVYLTAALQEKFVDAVQSEDDMWNSLSSFLETKINIKEWPRLFSLSDSGHLRLTRQTVSGTVYVDRVKPGYLFDYNVDFRNTDADDDRKLVFDYMNSPSHEAAGEIDFSNNGTQTALHFKTSFTEFFNNFISKYKFPYETRIGVKIFEKILRSLNTGAVPDEIDILLLRYKTGEVRALTAGNKWIKQLPQGRNGGTDFGGDRNLYYFDEESQSTVYFSNIFHLQIHLVRFTEDQPVEMSVPLLALNSPLSKGMITRSFATGTGHYGS